MFKAAIAVLALVASVAGGLYWQNGRLSAQIEAHEEAARKMQQALGSCNARAENIRKDAESDREIDNLPDLRKFLVPDDWMLPPGAAPAD